MKKFDRKVMEPFKYYKGLRIYTEQDRDREIEQLIKHSYQTKWNKWVCMCCPKWLQNILLP